MGMQPERDRSRRPTRRGRTVGWAAALLALACTASCAGSGGNGSGTSGSTPPVAPQHTTSSSSPAPSSAVPSTASARATATAALTRAVAALPKGSVSVAAVNLTSGVSISRGSKGGQWMASTYKLFLTEALLADDGSVDDADATAAIEHSDNAAGYRLFQALGSTSGTVDAFEKFGLTHTHLPADAYDPTFTTTSATDFIRILRNLVGPGQLSSSQRKYVLGLMSDVESDQRWGVGAAATGSFVNKNGWETVDSGNTPPEPSDDGLWIVNSVGIVDRDGQRLLMAVLTQHNTSFDGGIDLVERLAKLAAVAVTSGA